MIWIDLYAPTSSEVHQIMTEFSIPPNLVEDLLAPVPRSGAVTDGNVVKLTMDFPVVRRTDIKEPHEIKFLVSKDYLITIHYEDISALDTFKREFDVTTTLHKSSKKLRRGASFHCSHGDTLCSGT